jgi:hypothetical protein
VLQKTLSESSTRSNIEMTRVHSIQLAGLFAASIVLSGPSAAIAQDATTPSSMKTIGTPSAAAKPEIVPSLFVLNSRGATLQGDTLVLSGITFSSIIFADRPIRAAGHQPTAAGVNMLIGGSGRSFALQSVSVEGSVALNVTLGLSRLRLRGELSTAAGRNRKGWGTGTFGILACGRPKPAS